MIRKKGEEGTFVRLQERETPILSSQFDTSKADVLLLYLMPEGVSLLEPKLETGLKPTARVVSHDYPIKGLKPVRSEMLRYSGEPHFIYVYAPRGLADTRRRRNL